MKTRYSALVSVKKNSMQRSELTLGVANANLKSALDALESSYKELSKITTPSSGSMPEFLSSRMLLDAQRELIEHNKEWVQFAQQEITEAKERLKLDTLEYEKFNYLELQEVENELRKQKQLESKDLDEVALMTYDRQRYIKRVS